MKNLSILKASTAPIALGLGLASAPAFAQGQQPVEAVQGEEATEPEITQGPVIVVTGSLIRNPNLERSAPVNVTGEDEIELLQSNVAEEILREIPGVVPSIGSAVNNGNGGASFVNLRGLGSNRNLVLVDGVRLAPSGLGGVFDLNNIPLALVERVDVLTGGASTTYGADAISGVVNFITKSDFSGLEITASEQITERGDGNVFRIDATMGANFDDGRGNAVLAIGYQEADAIYQGERDISLTTIETFTGEELGSGTAVPSRLSSTRPLTDAGVPNTTAQLIQTGTTADGTPILAPRQGGAANGPLRQVDPATGQFVPTFSTFNFNPFNIFQTPFERYNIYGAANYEVSDAVEVYTRGLFSKQTVSTIVAPSGAFGIGVSIPLSNPFLTDTLRNQFCALNVAPSVAGVDANGDPISGQVDYTPLFTQAECNAAATATDPSDPDYRQVDNVALARRSVEAGPRTSDFTTTFFDYRLGLRGDITDSIGWDVFGTYGESERIQTIGGYFLNSRVRQSLLSTDPNACLDTSNGCVPANFFGAAGSISPEAVEFLVEPSTSFVKASQAQARATISGDFGWTLPWASDTVAFAIGGEYRRYQASQGADSLAGSGDLGGAGGATPSVEGGYDVYEAIGELVIPLVQDRPFFNNLTVEAGARYSSYTVDAPGNPTYDTWTYKGGATWEPVDGVGIRGTYARAVRAPNIAELFSPVNTGLTNLGVDPCATLSTDGSVIRGPLGGELLAVCLAQGATPGNVQSIPEPVSGQVLATGGGNLNIRPEKSDSYTIGAILQPAFLPGFTATIDYYNIKIEDAISSPTPGDVIAACFGIAGADGLYTPAAGASSSPACTSIQRDPITGGLSGDPNTSTGLPSTLSNSGSLETDGIDVVLSYATDLTDSIGLNLGFNGNYTFNSKFNAFVDSPVSVNRECTGYYSTNCGSLQPEYQFSQRTTLTFNDEFDLSLLWRHIASFEQEPLDVEASGRFFQGTIPEGVAGVGGRSYDFSRIEAYNYFDLSGRWTVTENMAFTLSVQNLLDKEPPLTGNNAGSTTFNSGNTFPSTYDTLGRRYTASVRLTF